MPTYEARADELVAAMTADELLECLDGDLDFWPGLADMIGGGILEHTYPGGSCERLGVEGIRFSDGPRGVVVGDATCFPVSMARGASWDPELEKSIGDAIGRELRAKGANFYGGVCINLLRHPAWGRAQETYGEDPFLVGEMGAALTSGVQDHTMACVKHFALNSMENTRFKVDVTVADDVLHEVYLPHFERVVRAGVASVMSAYKAEGLPGFHSNEDKNQDVPMPNGPYATFLEKLSSLQKRLPFGVEFSPVHMAIVTARNAPAEMRVISSRIRSCSGPIPSIGEIAPWST